MRVVHAATSPAATAAVERIELGDGAWLEWSPHFLAPAERPSAEALAAEIPLRSDTFAMFGRRVAVPRLIAWPNKAGILSEYAQVTCDVRHADPRIADTMWAGFSTRVAATLRPSATLV